jgi:hypothetical protein
MSNLTNIAIGLIVVGFLLVRQMQPRPARETPALRTALILAVIGIAEMKGAIGSRHLTAVTVAWLALSLLAAAGLGAIRAATVSIWRAGDGSAWRQGTILTASLWLASLALHLVLDAVIDRSAGIAALGTSSILLYLAVTLGVQRAIVRRRAPLPPDAAGHRPEGRHPAAVSALEGPGDERNRAARRRPQRPAGKPSQARTALTPRRPDPGRPAEDNVFDEAA